MKKLVGLLLSIILVATACSYGHKVNNETIEIDSLEFVVDTVNYDIDTTFVEIDTLN